MWNFEENFSAAEMDAAIVIPRYDNPFGNECGRNAERTRIVVDSRGVDVGHVTARYGLVRNPEVVATVEVLAEERGLQLERFESYYRNGRSWLTWKDKKNPIRVKGDLSYPTVQVENDYTGGRNWVMESGIWTSRCSNGLVMGQVGEIDSLRQKHVGQINVPELVVPMINRLGDQVEVIRLTLESLADHALSFAHPVFKDIKEDTPERYHDRLGRAVRENADTLGKNAYAVLQAITEVGTHEMRGMGGLGWSRRQADRIYQAVAEDGVDLAILN